MIVHVRFGMAIAVNVNVNRMDDAVGFLLENFGDDMVGYEAIAAGHKDRADARHNTEVKKKRWVVIRA